MIRKIGQAFVLDTAHTTYAFSILPGGHPEHLYYGRTIHIEHPDDLEILVEKHVFAPGNVNICEKEHAGFSLEDVRLEMSSYGKGDIREPFVEAILYDGAKTLDFRYEDAVITGKKDALDGLPGSYGSAGEEQQLCVTMVDRQYDLKLLLYYYVYEAADVIGRSAKIVNASSQDVQLTRLMSLQLDFDDSDYIFTTFRGAWAREMHRCDQTLTGGRIVNDSFTVSCRANSLEEATILLNALDTTIQQMFAKWRGKILLLNGEERLKCLHALLRPGKKDEEQYIYLDETGKHDWKNDVMPQTIKQYSNFMIFDKTQYVSVLFGWKYSRALKPDELMRSFSYVDFPSFITLDFSPVPADVINEKLVATLHT